MPAAPVRPAATTSQPPAPPAASQPAAPPPAYPAASAQGFGGAAMGSIAATPAKTQSGISIIFCI